MRESRLSGSVEGVMGNHDSYSDSSVEHRLKMTMQPACHTEGAERKERDRQNRAPCSAK